MDVENQAHGTNDILAYIDQAFGYPLLKQLWRCHYLGQPWCEIQKGIKIWKLPTNQVYPLNKRKNWLKHLLRAVQLMQKKWCPTTQSLNAPHTKEVTVPKADLQVWTLKIFCQYSFALQTRGLMMYPGWLFDRTQNQPGTYKAGHEETTTCHEWIYAQVTMHESQNTPQETHKEKIHSNKMMKGQKARLLKNG